MARLDVGAALVARIAHPVGHGQHQPAAAPGDHRRRVLLEPDETAQRQLLRWHEACQRVRGAGRTRSAIIAGRVSLT